MQKIQKGKAPGIDEIRPDGDEIHRYKSAISDNSKSIGNKLYSKRLENSGNQLDI